MIKRILGKIGLVLISPLILVALWLMERTEKKEWEKFWKNHKGE